MNNIITTAAVLTAIICLLAAVYMSSLVDNSSKRLNGCLDMTNEIAEIFLPDETE